MLEPEESLPAPGQGALAIECREDQEAFAAARRLEDPATAACVRAERAVSRALSGDCQLPLAAYARGNRRTDPLARTGGKTRRQQGGACGTERPVQFARKLGEALAASLRTLGADAILASLS